MFLTDMLKREREEDDKERKEKKLLSGKVTRLNLSKKKNYGNKLSALRWWGLCLSLIGWIGDTNLYPLNSRNDDPKKKKRNEAQSRYPKNHSTPLPHPIEAVHANNTY